ncbi:hypothetical protein R4L22_03040 [Brachyspira pilosicoli]|uniref:hypothetical protein n=1 Tax=Brachyspira pilosicoli TaxID=52584 RepID=UPI0012F4E41F|nr:hypothetical protein [Brachyspira pilosicoli]
MNKKLLLIIMTASVLLLSCSNKKTTGVKYSSASSSNETNNNETNTEINNNKEDIIKHEGTWSGELKSDNTIEYLPWKFVIKNDASIDVYISGSSYPEPSLSFDKIIIQKENTLEFTVIDDYISYKTISTFNADNFTENVVVEVSFTDDNNQRPVYYRGTMTKK